MSKDLVLSVQVPEMKAIGLNFDELKGQIANTMTIYKNKVYTEETRQLAKNDRADLNKFRTALDNKRKEVKKAWTAPLTEFEDKVKELMGLVSEPIDLIDEQVAEFEQKITDEKLAKVAAYYNEVVAEKGLEKILSWEKLEQKDWSNLTKTEVQIKKEIDAAADKTLADWATIEGMGSEYEFEMKETYKTTLDLQQAIATGQRLKDEAERKAAYEAERQARAEASKQEDVKELFVETKDAEKSSSVEAFEPVASEKQFTVRFKVTGTADELKELSSYLKSKGLKYEQIK